MTKEKQEAFIKELRELLAKYEVGLEPRIAFIDVLNENKATE